jgi:pimeloyl-ACP methyl ester carboxylesterase
VAEAPAPALVVPSDPEPSRLEMAYGPLAYVDEGPRDAPALLTAHGIPGSVRDFRYLAGALKDRVRVVRVDLPGFGGSAPERDAVAGFPGRARALLAVADHLELASFGVIGHSMGGGAALALAASQPRRVRLLVLVASVALSRHRGLGLGPWTFRAAAHGLSLPGLRALLLPALRAQYRRRRFPGVETMTVADFRRQLLAIAGCDFSLLRRLYAGALPRTVLAYTRDDHMVEAEISEELAAALPGARVLAFATGGHNLQKTRALELAEAVAQELAGEGPTPDPRPGGPGPGGIAP